MSKPKISVLLVVKNAFPLIVGALDSLKKQSFKDFDVIVADGASSDATIDALQVAAKDLTLGLVSEPDRSLAEGFAKALRRADGDIVGMLCADERYYPDTLERVVKWFDAEPNAVMCGGKVDFTDENDKVVGSHLTAPFNLAAHLACELVPSNLSSFFNRPLIGEDFRFNADVPTCPDYEYWARLGLRFPSSAFKRYDVSVAQAYRTRHSMSFRAESFTQFCRDKLAHLNNILGAQPTRADYQALRRRASAGIHMWAAEQLTVIEPEHADILAHCAAAARYDSSYERITRFVAAIDNVRYDASTGILKRNCLGARTTAVRFEYGDPPAYWPGAAILGHEPLILRTADDPWGFSLLMSVPKCNNIGTKSKGGQYWLSAELEVLEGSVGIGMFLPSKELTGQLTFRPADGHVLVQIPLTVDIDPATPLMVRSGGHPSSIVRIHRIELLYDPDPGTGIIVPIEVRR